MEMLMNTKETQQMDRDLFSGGAAFLLPKEGVEVVGLAQDSTFTNVKCLRQCLQVQQTPSQLQIRIGDVPLGFSDVTKQSTMYCGHLILQKMGLLSKPSRGTRCSAGNQTPPAFKPDASWWPSADASKGTSSSIRVGRFSISDSIQRKLSQA